MTGNMAAYGVAAAQSKFFKVAAVLCVTIAFSGCAGSQPSTRTVHEEEGRYIRLQSQSGEEESNLGQFAHPMVLPEAAWNDLLSYIYVQPQRKFLSFGTAPSVPTVAFNEDERRYLAKYLSQGLSEARPDERVVFYLSRPRERGLIEIDSGGLFIEAGRLHFVMANYHQPVSMDYIRQQIKNNPLRPAGDAFYEVIPRTGQIVRTAWYRDLSISRSKSVSQLVLDPLAFLDCAPDQPCAGNAFGSGHGSTVPAEAGHSVEERLRLLNRLREQGLITEEEFSTRRTRLLDGL